MPVSGRKIVRAIAQSGVAIYDPIVPGDSPLWIPTPLLEDLLNTALVGKALENLPLRTRSKHVKTLVCQALGYPVPTVFRKTKPRFPGQNFDTYVQKANNLQVWNEDLDPARRYVLIRVNARDTIQRVRVVTGESLALLDTTGTLTQKYQARLVGGPHATELICESDTEWLQPLLGYDFEGNSSLPTDDPTPGGILPIREIFARLATMVGTSVRNKGADQDRARGSSLHGLVCARIGYQRFRDRGDFPDIRHQLLEVKLQTSPTIDLGLVSPDSTDPLDVPVLRGRRIRHCDTRFAIVSGVTRAKWVDLTHLFVTTGESFFRRFPRFGGRILNKKTQIRLPGDFFTG